MHYLSPRHALLLAAALLLPASALAQAPQSAPVRINAKLIKTMAPAGDIIDGAIIIENGKITAVGKAATLPTPANATIIEANIAVPGLIDGRSTVGLSGLLNTKADSDQLERSAPIQPELRAIDAFNPSDPLVEFVRTLGVTTIHTGHAPGELVSGQTLIAKTSGGTVADCVITPVAMISATLGPSALKGGAAVPGNRSKAIALLRAELIKAQEYRDRLARPAKGEKADAPGADSKLRDDSKLDAESKPIGRDLRLESLVDVLSGKTPLLVTAQSTQDIAGALRLAEEFKFKLILDGGAECYTLIDQIKSAGIPIIIHPTMTRAYGEMQNASFETASKLKAAGIPFCFQAGYEAYVPKTRIVLFEAAMAAAHGLGQNAALRAITIDAANLLGISDRVGSLEPGKDGDVACYDGDPFEFTTHCTAVIIGGKHFPQPPR